MQPAPLFLDGRKAPGGGSAWWVDAADGVRLRVGVWPGGPRGTVLMFPGRTEYIEKYLLVASAMAEAGYATVIPDWRGQGLADRPFADRAIGHVARFRDYQADVAAVQGVVREMGLPGPQFLIAHSMGSCIGLRALMEGLPVRAAAFSGPMWGIRISPTLRPLAWTLGIGARVIGQGHRFAPTTGPASYVAAFPFEGNMLTTDPEIYAMMRDQITRHPELALGGPSQHWLVEALYEVRALRARPSPDLPCYCAIGGNERVIDVPAVTERMRRWPKGELEVLPGAEHEIIVERPELRDRFLRKSVELFDANA